MSFRPWRLAPPKLIVIFLVAILIPTLVVTYLTIHNITERRLIVRRLVMSSLWSAAERAVQAAETAFLALEARGLQHNPFPQPALGHGPEDWLDAYLRVVNELGGHPFLLDGDHRILFPRVRSENSDPPMPQPHSRETPFSQCINEAERAEFRSRDSVQAAGLYENCLKLAEGPTQEAAALSGYGRCLSFLGSPKTAAVFHRLADQYHDILDPAGHPYGISARIQLATHLEKKQDRQEIRNVLERLLRDLHRGTWTLNAPAYGFFASHVRSLLDRDEPSSLSADRSRQVKDLEAPYGQVVRLALLLEESVIPHIEVQQGRRPDNPEASVHRFCTPTEDGPVLASYTRRPDPSGQSVYAGICWSLSTLKEKLIPEALEIANLEEGLEWQLLEGYNETQDEAAATQEQSVILGFRDVPFPWRLRVGQSETFRLALSSRLELTLYATLLGVIVGLMLMGAFLMARDIHRETESNRMKSEFIRNVSHELRTPLSLIRLYGETLQENRNLTDEQRKDSYQIITKESERLSHLINNILDLSKMETGTAREIPRLPRPGGVVSALLWYVTSSRLMRGI